MNTPQKEYGWITAITPEEIKALGKPQPGDEIYSSGRFVPRCECETCMVSFSDKNAYRRKSKSKPVEQYGWLKPDCGVETPLVTPFPAVLENGQSGNIHRQNNASKYRWQNGVVLESPIAFWFRREPKPAAVNVGPMQEAMAKYWERTGQHLVNEGKSNVEDAYKAAWQACCDHYKVGDQKGAK